MNKLLTKIKSDFHYMVKGFKLVFCEEIPEIKDDTLDKNHEKLLKNINIVKTQKKYVIKKKFYNGKYYFIVWDNAPKCKYTKNIREVETSLSSAINYARFLIEKDEEEFVETLAFGWEDVDLDFKLL